jgi:hypothetical protein
MEDGINLWHLLGQIHEEEITGKAERLQRWK